MSSESKPSLGQLGENIAMAHLKQKGYRIHIRNWRFGKLGEIDIIAIPPSPQENTLVFCEVKCRRGASQGYPLEAITPQKQNQLFRLAEAFLMNQPQFGEMQVRFDVIGVFFSAPRQPAHIEHLENALFLME